MATKITNSVLFKACKWLTENTEITCEWLDTHNSREIVDMYELRSGTYTVEYGRGMGTGRWRHGTYADAVKHVASVVRLAEDLGGVSYVMVQCERTFDDVTRKFDVPAWL